MNICNLNPRDYSDNKLKVRFLIGGLDSHLEIKQRILSIDYCSEIQFSGEWFITTIAIQQIPDIIKYLAEHNIAIYAVIPENN